MILNNNSIGKTHYDIIGVNEDASQEEIRRTYRTAILNYHPDKMQSTSTPERELNDNRFLEVQRAWKVLADPKSRALYDNELQTLRQDTVTADDISLEDMNVEGDGNYFELSYNCRCGDCFSVDSSDLEEMGYSFLRHGSEISLQTPGSLPASIILPCGSCSLKVRLFIKANAYFRMS
ncbi:hypothetical protein ACJIZ3_002581 [Penstemon smallii]|uniref:Uncharacterized protein n=1 Tax=Penstemon smallii TaxID=265156 RepID=A0ABD3UAK6_9LAMI